MTVGLLKGTNAAGHIGWVTVYCSICNTKLSLSGYKPRSARQVEVVYACPRCLDEHESYFCAADARRVKFRCPYCGSKLVLASPLSVEG